jgi:hypothetical protein
MASAYVTPTVPPDKVVDVIVRAGATAMVKPRAVLEFPSLAVTVKDQEPDTVGAPAIMPLGFRESPWGSDPVVSDQEYVPVPPVAESVWVYAAPTVALGSDDVVTVS